MFSFFNSRKKSGIDIVTISRFKQFENDKTHHFLHKTFTKEEIDYCFCFKEPASHLAGIFCAKEAVSKALGVNTFPFIEIEIRHRCDGAPYACSKGKELRVSVSISHTEDMACAIALG